MSASTEVIAALQSYARRIRDALRANASVPETGLAPEFQTLVAELLPLLDAVPKLTVSPEFKQPGVGRPDIALIRPGQPPRAFIELKAPAKPANPAQWRDAHDKRQRDRLQELNAWAACNFEAFHLFHRAAAVGAATVVPAAALDPATSEKAADALVAAHDAQPFLHLLATLARADAPAARNAQELAALMAHAARLVRSAVEERLAELHAAKQTQHPLMMVRNTFRNVLYAHPEAGGYANADFDTLFSSAFAQTLAFGLLLVREAIEDDPALTDKTVGADAWTHMPDEHPLMKAALRVLSEAEVVNEIGIGVAVMRDTVNSFAAGILAVGKDGRDPILYFYEDFLQTFDPVARDRYGVYYTPVEVVRYMAGALDRALRERLGTAGLRDPEVTILDPATGTGTFLLGIAERVRDQVMADEGGVAASMELKTLASRMFGFELLVGPYAVAHYRLHHALRYRPADEDEDAPQPVKLPRLGVYLADTLSQPGAVTAMGTLGIQGIPIDEERAEANRIKAEQQVLAIIGNPPYKRLEEGETDTLVGRWMDGVWDDLKAPVRAAGQGGQLNTFPEFSVAFWRWAIWKLFEAENAPQRSVIAFITNRKFLTGWPYAGLRQMMRRRFDRIEIIDLRGDVRAGPRGDVDSDQGVFNIMVGTAITLAIADGSKPKGALAEVRYVDAWQEGLFARKAKLAWLAGAADMGLMADAGTIARPELDDWRPAPFQNSGWLSLREAFAFSKSGMKSGNDPVFVAVEPTRLQTQVAPFLILRNDPSYDAKLVKPLAYRPLDRRFFYADLQLLNRPGPDMQRAWGEQNVGLYALKSNTGAGPAVWCHSSPPDYHALKGSTGGYAFPLYDRRKGLDALNLNLVLVESLSVAYGAAQSPADIFDAILCLLSARSYTRRFAEDLEDTFPHVPFPADLAVFDQAVALGCEIRALEAFERKPQAGYMPKTFAKLASEPDGVFGAIAWREGEITLCENGTGRITGIPKSVWTFAVSGYRVLPRWIDGRKGLPATKANTDALRDVAGRIAELIHRFDEADLVLEATLADTLTRDKLGFPDATEQEVPDDD